MCQRVMIAIAISSDPWLLIADEPVTGLDVTTQALIMDLVSDAARERNMATILALDGHVVEVADTERLFMRPRHPYTAKLIRATPNTNGDMTELSSKNFLSAKAGRFAGLGALCGEWGRKGKARRTISTPWTKCPFQSKQGRASASSASQVAGNLHSPV